MNDHAQKNIETLNEIRKRAASKTEDPKNRDFNDNGKYSRFIATLNLQNEMKTHAIRAAIFQSVIADHAIQANEALSVSSKIIESYGQSIITANEVVADEFKRMSKVKVHAARDMITVLHHRSEGIRLAAEKIAKSAKFEYNRLQTPFWYDPFYFDNRIGQSKFNDTQGVSSFRTPILSRKIENNISLAFGLQGFYKLNIEAKDRNARADLERNMQAYALLFEFEEDLRNFINDVMIRKFGLNWIEFRIPKEMGNRWKSRKSTSLAAGQTERRLIDYAQFTDYCDIIVSDDNWIEVFQTAFQRRESVRESFQRLYPVRNSIMHARLIDGDEPLFLISEIRRLRNAIGI